MSTLSDRLAPYTFTSEPYRMGAGRRPIVHHFWQLFDAAGRQVACGYGSTPEQAEQQVWTAYTEKTHETDRRAHRTHGEGSDSAGREPAADQLTSCFG